MDRNTTPETAEMAKFYEETLGFTPNSLFTMMHRPRIASAFLEMNQAMMENKGRVTSDLKRLIDYISSMTTACRYCEAHAIRAADRYGFTEDKLQNIWDYKTYPAISHRERAAFDLAVAASSVPNAVNDEISEIIHKYWIEGEVVEILGVISLYGYLNRSNDSMGTQLEAPAAEDGEHYLSKNGWNIGKHNY